jgi:hypothetical protein
LFELYQFVHFNGKIFLKRRAMYCFFVIALSKPHASHISHTKLARKPLKSRRQSTERTRMLSDSCFAWKRPVQSAEGAAGSEFVYVSFLQAL